jgi:cytosine/adenosine deaminase-related metal-dependent hydrolase
MIHGTAGDFKRLAEARVPVAVCTRSNAFFGLTAPVPLMVEAGVDVRIGTDNAFLGAPDLFAEARAFTHAHKAKAALTPMQILSFLFARKPLNGGLAIAPAEGGQPDFLIVNIQTEKPQRDLLAKASAEDVVAVVGRQSE